MRKSLSDAGVAGLKARAKRYAEPDPQLTGHYVRVTPNGVKTFVAVARDPTNDRQVWATIGGADLLTVEEAREKARDAIKRIKAGKSPFETPVKAESFEDVAEQWMKRHVAAKGLLSAGDLARLLKTHVYPRWGNRPFLDIRRSDVAALLDHVEDNCGARQADMILAIVRSVMNWRAARSDDYSAPISRGMRRTNPKERARSRTLSDDDLRAVWRAAEDDGAFGAFVRLLLLTGQRRDKLASMRWTDVAPDATWMIPAEAREKGNGGELKLPKAAIDIIRAQPMIGDSPYVFAGRSVKGKEHAYLSGYGKRKRAFDTKVGAALGETPPPWTLHDLRRTARSLMSRAGVPSEHAERVMGHVQGGVEGVYDRHHYRPEKAAALAKLAALIDAIVHPRDTVVTMPKPTKGRR
jgi:integrase